MSEEIKPALTAEEWSAGWSVVFGVEGEGDEVAAVIRNRHGMAAKCLHGQPFGFTREDVVRLREVENYYEGIYDGDDGEYWRMYRWAGNLANRIEALLPPEDSDDG